MGRGRGAAGAGPPGEFPQQSSGGVRRAGERPPHPLRSPGSCRFASAPPARADPAAARGEGGGAACSAGPCAVPEEGSFPVLVDQYHFYFDISAMEKGEQMLKAEFRVFKLKRTRVSRRSDVQHFCKVSGEIICRLSAYLCFRC